jgi:hypothetical protein
MEGSMPRVETLLAALKAKPGTRVALRVASGFSYAGVLCEDPGMILTLRGERGDVKLLEHGYVYIHEGAAFPCKVKGCGKKFVGPDTLKMHHARRHEQRPAGPTVAEADPERLRRHLKEQDARGLKEGRSAR